MVKGDLDSIRSDVQSYYAAQVREDLDAGLILTGRQCETRPRSEFHRLDEVRI